MQQCQTSTVNVVDSVTEHLSLTLTDNDGMTTTMNKYRKLSIIRCMFWVIIDTVLMCDRNLIWKPRHKLIVFNHVWYVVGFKKKHHTRSSIISLYCQRFWEYNVRREDFIYHCVLGLFNVYTIEFKSSMNNVWMFWNICFTFCMDYPWCKQTKKQLVERSH